MVHLRADEIEDRKIAFTESATATSIKYEAHQEALVDMDWNGHDVIDPDGTVILADPVQRIDRST